ncbi:hypothetical protein [Streptomyces sp. NPDC030920]|uniref:hypothetical protein n=1 Tax=Streptomyces sp. NPDC030920 TaxID=3365308 RepID=UPI00384C6931
MVSVLGMLEEREAVARVRVEGLREEAARLAEVLEAAEIELDRRVIAREELVEALAVSAAETTAVTGPERETVPSPVPGSVVPLAGRAAGDRARARLPADCGCAGEAAVRGRGTSEGQGDRGGAGPFGGRPLPVDEVAGAGVALVQHQVALIVVIGPR